MAKILLVEDERNIASFIERGLHEFGHTVSVTHDGTTAWELLQHEAFDLLVLDIIMPGINGLDLCRQYRQKRISDTCHHAHRTRHYRRYSERAGCRSG